MHPTRVRQLRRPYQSPFPFAAPVMRAHKPLPTCTPVPDQRPLAPAPKPLPHQLTLLFCPPAHSASVLRLLLILHRVFMVQVEQGRVANSSPLTGQPIGAPTSGTLVAKMYLVDLAGSERIHAYDKVPERLRESQVRWLACWCAGVRMVRMVCPCVHVHVCVKVCARMCTRVGARGCVCACGVGLGRRASLGPRPHFAALVPNHRTLSRPVPTPTPISLGPATHTTP